MDSNCCSFSSLDFSISSDVRGQMINSIGQSRVVPMLNKLKKLE
jgi:hypothetical protein